LGHVATVGTSPKARAYANPVLTRTRIAQYPWMARSSSARHCDQHSHGWIGIRGGQPLPIIDGWGGSLQSGSGGGGGEVSGRILLLASGTVLAANCALGSCVEQLKTTFLRMCCRKCPQNTPQHATTIFFLAVTGDPLPPNHRLSDTTRTAETHNRDQSRSVPSASTAPSQQTTCQLESASSRSGVHGPSCPCFGPVLCPGERRCAALGSRFPAPQISIRLDSWAGQVFSPTNLPGFFLVKIV
jgi:hypothetical protein